MSASLDDSLLFNKTDVNKFITTPSALIRSYKQPSIVSTESDQYVSNLVIPVFYETNDIENGIEGLWYSDTRGWIEAYKVNLVPSGTYSGVLQK